MPTIRGFVERLEVGRAGLALASVLQDDGSRTDYQLADLDADPERFNERLSKLGLLRDAMSRAEPVEIDYTAGDGGTRSIDRICRITRDVLAATGPTDSVSVYVVGISVLADNRTGASGEVSDTATVVTMTDSGVTASYVLDLQFPERAVAGALLQMLRDAQADGQPVTLLVDSKRQRIVGAQAGGGGGALQAGKGGTADGFVESITVAPGLTPMGNLAIVAFTTAPPFGASGNVVSLVPFTPALEQLLVVQGSVEYDLFVAGLRDRLRMRVMLGATVGGGQGNTPSNGDTPGKPKDASTAPSAAARAPGDAAADGNDASDAMTLVRGTQLVAALASASRPVWIRIVRQSLDIGPEGVPCVDGLPTSDLSPQTLRDLRLPYTAEWLGWGCFNHGVYRLQFDLDVDFEVFIDGKLLCLHASDDGKVRFAHACLHDEHEVRVVLRCWTCTRIFQMDIYRIR